MAGVANETLELVAREQEDGGRDDSPGAPDRVVGDGDVGEFSISTTTRSPGYVSEPERRARANK